MRGLLAIVAAACFWAGPAGAATIVLDQSGTTTNLMIDQPLPDIGRYRADITASVPITVNFIYAHILHTDVYTVPGLPHDQGAHSETPVFEYANRLGTAVSWNYFTVFGFAYEISSQPKYVEWRIEDPRLLITATNADGLPFDYSLIISRVSGIPEPATWAMMILGFGLAGSALRRRRQVMFVTA